MALGIHPLQGRVLLVAVFALCAAAGCGTGGEVTVDNGRNERERGFESFSAGQIAGAVSVINDTEQMQAKRALSRLQDESVRAYAERLIQDHQAAEAELNRILGQMQISEQGSPVQDEMQLLGENMRRHIERETPQLVDQTFLEVQLFMHRKSIIIVEQQLLPHAGQSEMQAYLEKFLGTLRQHLGQAVQLRKEFPTLDPGI
ncbi:MAG: DUF4142 domain-containing protein [Polyangiaceae bacterium]|nr:DUF4142 domain-containing protein [Polyangiaceae bacterium]